MEVQPDEAILNNVRGTHHVVELCLEFGVERLVNISTDKAVNPTSVMGASKRVAEQVVAWGASRAAPGQAFISVRFGNVLGSRGSVVPLFLEQIKKGGPVTVTHPEMRRYFMTIPEAAQLVLQAGGMGENGRVYVLDMGEPVRILDLAKDLIRLAGFELYRDIDIVFTGVRPGEKLFEELLTAEEGTEASYHEKIWVAKPSALPREFSRLLEELYLAARRGDERRIRELLRQLIPTYKPNGIPAEKLPEDPV
jgi:FlaA1/EpsC-like NDP-sugar epimerase